MTPIHGGPDAAGVPRHDFSTNSNACGPCPEALRAVQAADATRYPDPAYAALRNALGALHGVAPERIVVAASASEFIHRITALAALRGTTGVVVPAHGYGDYAQAALARGLALVRSCAGDGQSGAPGLQWACEPSSPQGLADPALRGGPREGAGETLRVLDCAYAPLRLQSGPASTPEGGFFSPAPSGWWQLWTPNKALGLTGVRAAYAIAPEREQSLVDALAALAPSWPVGAHGVAMLEAWAQPSVRQWLAQSLATLRAWKARQLAVCEALGWEVQPGSLANYFCAAPDGTASGLVAGLAALRATGIKLRDCASFGLPGQVRLAALPPASQDALHTAWRALQAPSGCSWPRLTTTTHDQTC